jgi:hypothetical protein
MTADGGGYDVLAVVEDDERGRVGEHGTEPGHDVGIISRTTGIVEDQVGEQPKHRLAGSNARQVREPGARQ